MGMIRRNRFPSSKDAAYAGMVLDKDRAVFYPLHKSAVVHFGKQALSFKEVHNGTKRGRHHEGMANDVDWAGHQGRG